MSSKCVVDVFEILVGSSLGGCDQRLTARMIGVKKKAGEGESAVKLVKGNQRLTARRNEGESAG